MRVRLLFKTYEISDVNKQQLLYGVAVLISILSVFSIIFMLSYYSEDPAAAAFPSPTGKSAFTNNLSQAANSGQQVAGAQTQNQQPPQEEVIPQPVVTPTPKPSPSAVPSPSTPLPSPSASPSSSPSPSPSVSPSPTPDNRPKITNIAESDKSDTSIKFKFSVDKSSDCKAQYWSNQDSKKEQESSTKRTTSPEITLTGLNPGTEYTYSITCTDPDSGSSATAGEYKFKTN